ncbi:MAG: hypothetical protein RRC07_09265 [Anaerolineae bacterium]|nr:hypothetical protein [Anaerolineae bacterium]
MANYLMIRAQEEERIFTRSVAARLARITLDFLEACEREALVTPGQMAGGGEGYTPGEIEEMARIYRLQRDLGLEFGAVEVVLHMRQQMLEMLDEIERLEVQMIRREERLHNEIQRLRRQLARDAGFR